MHDTKVIPRCNEMTIVRKSNGSIIGELAETPTHREILSVVDFQASAPPDYERAAIGCERCVEWNSIIDFQSLVVLAPALCAPEANRLVQTVGCDNVIRDMADLPDLSAVPSPRVTQAA
jgi:hypothetical protein